MVAFRQSSTTSVHKTIGKPRQLEAARSVRKIYGKIMSCREPTKKVPQLFEDIRLPEFTDLVLERVSESLSMASVDDGIMKEGDQDQLAGWATKLGLRLILPAMAGFPCANGTPVGDGVRYLLEVKGLLVSCLMLENIYEITARFWGIPRHRRNCSSCVPGGRPGRPDFVEYILIHRLVIEWNTSGRWNGIGWKISNDLRIAATMPIIHRDVLFRCLEAALVLLGGVGYIDNPLRPHKCELSHDDWNSLDKKFFHTTDLREQVLLAKSMVDKYAEEQSIAGLTEEMEKLTA